MSEKMKSLLDLKSHLKYILFNTIERKTLVEFYSFIKNFKFLQFYFTFLSFSLNNEENFTFNLNLTENNEGEQFLASLNKISNTDLSDTHSKWLDTLATIFIKSVKIKEVLVKYDDQNVTENQLVQAINSISVISYLNSLSLSFKFSSDIITEKVTIYFKEFFKKLDKLDKISIRVEYSPLLMQGDYWKFIISSLEESVNNITSLKLTLNNLMINCYGMVYLSNITGKLINLISLRLELENNIIYHTGIDFFTKSMISLGKLNDLMLNFSQNFIGIKGGLLFSNYLIKTKLKSLELVLNYCDLDDLGGIMLLESISKLTGLRKLIINLKSNKLGDEFARIMMSSLFNLTNLEEIYLNIEGNNLSEEMKEELLEKLGWIIRI
jgi:hypothetical protein